MWAGTGGPASQRLGFLIYKWGQEMMMKVTRGSDFPGGPVAKTLPSNAGGVGSTPGRGTKIPHATEQLSLKVLSHPKLNKYL